MEDDIKALSNYEAFARFIQSVESAREECISDLNSSNVEQVQQLAGRILAYDDLMKMANWESLRVRHRETLA